MIKPEDTNFGQMFANIRTKAGLKQADVAKKLTFDTSRISRIETGSISLTLEEKEALLKEIGTEKAENYLAYLKQDWKELEKPSFDHPQKEILYDAELRLQKLKKLLEEENLSNYLAGEAKMHQQSLFDNVKSIQSTNHSIAYVGDIGVGKTTAICTQTGLIMPNEGESNKIETVLEVGSGRTTICEVRIRQGLIYSLLIEPMSDSDIYEFSSELCADIFDKKEIRKGEDTVNSKRVSEEITRALRNMSNLTTIKPPIAEDGKKGERLDQLKELAKTQVSLEALSSEFNQRLSLWKRTKREISYATSSGLSELKWLQKTFKEINNGRHEEFSLPKRIVITIPFKPIEIPTYEIEIIDTKGVDNKNAVRPDLQSCIDEQGTIILLCSRFNDAPATSVQTLLEHLKETEQTSVLNEKISILVLPHEGEALAVKDDNGTVDDIDEGCEVKSEQIETALGQINISNIPIYFFDSKNDDSNDLNKFIEERLNNLRNAKVKRIQSINDAVDYLVEHKEQENVRLSQKAVAKSIKIFLDQNTVLPEQNRDVTRQLFSWMRNAHARTVWASMRRNGHWGNLNVYFYIGNGTRQEVSKDSSKIFIELDSILKNLLGDEGLEPSHAFLEELRLNCKSWNSNFLSQVQRIGSQIFLPSLDKSLLWNDCANLYGYGSGFRDEVVSKLKAWFENKEQKPLFDTLNERIQNAWDEEVLNQLRNLIDEN